MSGPFYADPSHHGQPAEAVVKRALLLAVFIAGFGSQSLAEEPVGRLCLAAVPTPTPGERSLSNPTGGLPDATYSIGIDAAAPLELSRSTGIWSPPLAVDVRHTVSVFQDQTRIESFHFRFKPGETTELCLFMNSLYETWTLEYLERTGSWCSCGPVPGS